MSDRQVLISILEKHNFPTLTEECESKTIQACYLDQETTILLFTDNTCYFAQHFSEYYLSCIKSFSSFNEMEHYEIHDYISNLEHIGYPTDQAMDEYEQYQREKKDQEDIQRELKEKEMEYQQYLRLKEKYGSK